MAEKSLLSWYGEALDLFRERVLAIGADQWAAPTPCTDWTVRDLVNHLAVEQMWVRPLVTDGLTMAEVGHDLDGDQLGSDPAATWTSAAAGAREAFNAPGALERTVHLSYGDSTAAAYASQMTTDAVIHSWDLAHGLGEDLRIPEGLINFTYQELSPYIGTLHQTGLFAAPVEVSANANRQTKLLALVGRRA